jgi:molecular chaperone DnaK
VASAEMSANNPLTDGSGVIDGIPPQPPGEFAKIDIVLQVDEDGLLVLHATERSTQKALEIKVRVGMSAQELEAAMSSVSKIAVSS